MPKLPIYDSQRNLETRTPGPELSGSAERVKSTAKPFEAAGELLFKWQEAISVNQYTTAKYNFDTAKNDIIERAIEDPEYNNSEQYIQDLDKARLKSLEGISNKLVEDKASLEIGHDFEISKIKINSIYRKKLLKHNQAVLYDYNYNNQQAYLQSGDPKIMKDTLELNELNYKSGVISKEQLEKYRNDIKEWEYDRAMEVAYADPKAAMEMHSAGLFDMTGEQNNKFLKNMKQLKARDEIIKEQAMIANRYSIISDIAAGKIDVESYAEVINKVAGTDKELAEALQKNMDEGGFALEHETNEPFMNLVTNLFKSKNDKVVSEFLVDSLNEPTISRDRLASIVYAAKKRGEELTTDGEAGFWSNLINNLFGKTPLWQMNAVTNALERASKENADDVRSEAIYREELYKQADANKIPNAIEFDSVEEAESADLPKGTMVIIKGRRAIVE